MMQKGLELFAKLSCRWRYGRLLSAHLDDELDSQATEALPATCASAAVVETNLSSYDLARNEKRWNVDDPLNHMNLTRRSIGVISYAFVTTLDDFFSGAQAGRRR